MIVHKKVHTYSYDAMLANLETFSIGKKKFQYRLSLFYRAVAIKRGRLPKISDSRTILLITNIIIMCNKNLFKMSYM